MNDGPTWLLTSPTPRYGVAGADERIAFDLLKEGWCQPSSSRLA